MRGAFGLCCCGKDGCTGCYLPSSVDLRNANITWSTAFLHGFSAAACSGTDGGGSPWSADQYVRPESSIASGVTARKRQSLSETGIGHKSSMATGKELCQWLWNDPVYYRYVYHQNLAGWGGAYPAEATLVDSYVPENATDSTSPWNRVVESSSAGTICGDCVPPDPCDSADKWKCGQHLSFVSGVLYLASGYTPYSELSTYNCIDNEYVLFKPKAATGTFTWFWVFELTQQVTRVYQSGAVVSGIDNTTGTYAFPSTCGGWDNATAGTGQGTTSAALQIIYAKEVECVDVAGEPFTMIQNAPYAVCALYGAEPYTQFPDEVTVQFDEF